MKYPGCTVRGIRAYLALPFPPRRYDMNGRSQMQGGKNWILPREINANRFFLDSHWLEIWKNHLCPCMGPYGGSVAMDSAETIDHGKKDIWNGHGYRQSHWVRLTVTVCILFCSWWECAWVHYRSGGLRGDSMTDGSLKNGFYQRDLGQTEHQRYLNKKLIGELHGDVETIQTS